MNKETRARITNIVNVLDQVKGLVEQAHGELENLQSEEQDKYDNLTDGIQNSEVGEKIDAAANNLQEAVDAADEANQALETCIEKLNEATE